MHKLIEKYRWIMNVSDQERTILESWQSNAIKLTRGEDLLLEGISSSQVLSFLSQGRMFASRLVDNGQRAITRLYFSGDFVGTANVPFADSVYTVTAATDSIIYRIPNQQIVASFQSHPRIAAMFYTFAALENAVLTDRLVSIGRTKASTRLANFLLEVVYRREMTGNDVGNPFPTHLTQLEIGDAVGLTPVHVSRTFKELNAAGAVTYDKMLVTIKDMEMLKRLGDFENRYDEIDRSWFDDYG